ncbi:DUF397 domain-containing protein [Lentzea sp. NBRC 105346]|uniref:DUF397 domain-containing protein n=1 Tax=Lentzea sp. NBRC 105346 TaxID=3032205 RepID=UPI0024A17DCA|nr:DUF397 domain-containing protein [Lentzea sp. NBRC 105346]GLZ29282.1 DUF397 domain-containing protein [Lentzea sp. NBRC 105346]
MSRESTWRKSSYSSNTDGSSCVEVAFAQVVRVRDSKNTGGSSLAFSAGAWRAFASRVGAQQQV